jgi:hypothetical protein
MLSTCGEMAATGAELLSDLWLPPFFLTVTVAVTDASLTAAPFTVKERPAVPVNNSCFNL